MNVPWDNSCGPGILIPTEFSPMILGRSCPIDWTKFEIPRPRSVGFPRRGPLVLFMFCKFMISNNIFLLFYRGVYDSTVLVANLAYRMQPFSSTRSYQVFSLHYKLQFFFFCICVNSQALRPPKEVICNHHSNNDSNICFSIFLFVFGGIAGWVVVVD